MDIRNVLFPTDFSEVSARAERVAAATAREAGARLHVLHACPSHWDHVSAAEGIEAVADGLTGRGIETETALSTGPPAAQIVRYAREHAIDLIVLATHGRTGVSRALLGSVAEAVVRLAPCPVLTVPAGAPAEAIAAPLPIKRRLPRPVSSAPRPPKSSSAARAEIGSGPRRRLPNGQQSRRVAGLAGMISGLSGLLTSQRTAPLGAAAHFSGRLHPPAGQAGPDDVRRDGHGRRRISSSVSSKPRGGSPAHAGIVVHRLSQR